MEKEKSLVKVENPPKDKFTVYDYENSFSRRQNVRGAKALLRFLVVAAGIIMIACLLSIVEKAWKIHEYFGYGVGVACLLVFIFAYIVPVIKLFKTDYFITNVNGFTAAKSIKHNKSLRRSIAEKMIDFTGKVEGVGWYDSKLVGDMAIAIHNHDDKRLSQSLSALYSGCVKKSANDIIVGCAVKSGLYSAISQSNSIDSLLVTTVNMQMIKDLVFLYGFRPSDAKLVKIFASVLKSSLVAYGMDGIKIGNGVVKTFGDIVKGVPILGSAISVIVDSSVQGLANGTLTAVIGYQTIRYLNKEYHLQEILDNVDLPDDEQEFYATCTEIKEELKKQQKNKKSTEEK